MKCNWCIKKLSEIAHINPKESIGKGIMAKKVPMDKLQPFCRDIPEFILEEYKGGAKFRNGDTIMARITPCLENGKISKVSILDDDEVGFGSTEYIVFRAIEGVSDADFLYYLICSPLVRNPAIKSMVGSSDRQRVQTDVVVNLDIELPNIKEQRKIGSILRALDDKIALNNAINNNLEQQAQAIFKEWFIDNPENNKWSTGTFSELINSTLNGDWGKETPTGNNIEKVYCIRGADIPEVKAGNKGKMPTRYILPKNFVTKQLTAGDIVVEISGGSPTQSTGRCTAITQSLLDRYDSGMVCTNFCKAIKPKEGYSLFIYYYWQYLYSKGVFFSYENGTTGIKNLDFSGFIETETILIPPADQVIAFDNYCKSIFNQVFANGKQNEHLAVLRDTLLPKLMSGELDVPDTDL
ncbi:restriction endonuclease subunit S [Granulicatella sp. WM01]|uniref:restriction endonuclease subunit S n=1 Tax=unclassified Granulicatella TaxID=2630493 RepID=UPI001ADD9490